MIRIDFYSGNDPVYLPVHRSDTEQWLTSFIDPMEIFEFDSNTTQHSLQHLGAQDPPLIKQIKIGRVSYPTCASSFAQAHFLATDPEWQAIKNATNQINPSIDPQPCQLTLTDGAGGSVSFIFYLLPPRPLSQLINQDGSRLWLLTFVDVRYFWWSSKYRIALETNGQSFPELIGQVAGNLNVSLDVSTINSSYGRPSDRFDSWFQPSGLLLDAICRLCGTRYVHKLDGTGEVQSYIEAKSIEAQALSQFDPDRLAGGRFDEIARVMPARINVLFGRISCGQYQNFPYVVGLNLTSIQSDLALLTNAYNNIQGIGNYAIVGDLDAIFPNNDCLIPTNSNQLALYARQTAIDWYLWQTFDKDIVYSGIINYPINAGVETIEWIYEKDMVQTRVMRSRMNDRGYGSYRVSSEKGYLSSYLSPQDYRYTKSCAGCSPYPYSSENQTFFLEYRTCLSYDSAGRPILTSTRQKYTLPFGMEPVGDPICEENPQNCCTGDSGGGGGSNPPEDGVMTACCDPVQLPLSLSLTISATGDCSCFNGNYTLTWNGSTQWAYIGILSCPNFSNVSITFSCFSLGSGFALNISCDDFDNIGSTELATSCSPFYWESSVAVSTIGGCCDSGAVNMIVTEI